MWGSLTKFSGWSKLATEISSSTASQWRPMPPPIRSQSARCLGVASRRRGNHARGAETARPSDRVTVSVSPVQDASTARTSTLSAKVCMPPLQEELPVLDNDLVNLGKLMPAKAPHVGKRHWLQPILRVPSGVCHMNVRWLAPFHAEEEESVSTNPQQRWHIGSLSWAREKGKKGVAARGCPTPRLRRGANWRPRPNCAKASRSLSA